MCARIYPQNIKNTLKKNSKIAKHIPKIIPNLYIYIYIYIYRFCGHRPGSSLVRSRRELDAPKRAPENLDPKTHTLGVEPAT